MGPKRNSRRNNRNHHDRRLAYQPVVVYSQLSPAAENVIMAKNFSITDFLSDNTYSYDIESITITMMAPATVVKSPNWTSVNNVTAQIYGFMQQDSTLQRLTMTTWRQLSTTQPTHFHFNRKFIMRHIYAGGLVPITNINADSLFGIHALWVSGSSGTPTDLEMQIDATVRVTFKFGFDIQIGQVTANSSEKHMVKHMASLTLKDKID